MIAEVKAPERPSLFAPVTRHEILLGQGSKAMRAFVGGLWNWI